MYYMYQTTCMSKDPRKAPQVREPVQVYLAPDDSALLSRVVEQSGLSKAEILRRGLRSFAAAQKGNSPMIQFLESSDPTGWNEEVAVDHDAILADEYRARSRRRR